MRKYIYNPSNREIRDCGQKCHADNVKQSENFDKLIRFIVFPECKRIYFRFYSPNGEYTYLDQTDFDLSFSECEKVVDRLLKKKIINKTYKILFWQNDNKVRSEHTKL